MRSVRILFGVSIFWLALSMLSDGLNTLFLPYALLRLSGGEQAAGLAGLLRAGGLLAGMLVMPLAGAWSDRQAPQRGRRGLLVLGSALMIAALALLAAAGGLLALIAGYALAQIAGSSAQAAQQGLLPDQVAPAARGKASGLKGFMDLAGALLAFVVLGALIGAGRAELALAAIAVVIVVALALTVVLLPEVRREPAHPLEPSASPGPLAAFHFDFARHGAFAWLVAARFLFLLGTYAVGQYLLLFVAVRLGLAPEAAAEQAAGLLAALTLITALAAPLGGWAADRWGRVRLMAAGAVLNAAGILLLTTAANTGQILLFGGLMALGSGAFASANWALAADLAPPAEAGRFLALANIGTAGALVASGLLGPLVDAAGYDALFVAAALASLASLAALVALRRLRAAGSGATTAPALVVVPVAVDAEEHTAQL